MSGGFWNYADENLKHDIFGWDCDGRKQRVRDVLEDRELSELLFDVFELLHEFDWYQSGDTCEDTWLEAKKKFKAKWFRNEEVRAKHIVDSALEELRQDLYKTYGLEDDDDKGR